MVIPPYLKPGDSIALIAPARKVVEAEMDPSIRMLSDEGFNVITGNNLYGISHQFSGTDDQRLADLQEALDSPIIKAIFCARGGYGSLRLLEQLALDGFLKNPKWLVGYSDITAIHAKINNAGVASIHATMPINFTKDKESFLSVMNMLKGKSAKYTTPAHPLQRNGAARAELRGGNLSLLYALLGSEDFPSLKGKILFLEDLDEYLYHIDRMMIALRRSGALDGLAGLLVGGMTEMKDNTVPYGQSAQEIIRDCVAAYHYPVYFDFPAGHTTRNLALKLGSMVALEVNEGGCTLNME